MVNVFLNNLLVKIEKWIILKNIILLDLVEFVGDGKTCSFSYINFMSNEDLPKEKLSVVFLLSCHQNPLGKCLRSELDLSTSYFFLVFSY